MKLLQSSQLTCTRFAAPLLILALLLPTAPPLVKSAPPLAGQGVQAKVPPLPRSDRGGGGRSQCRQLPMTVSSSDSYESSVAAASTVVMSVVVMVYSFVSVCGVCCLVFRDGTEVAIPLFDWFREHRSALAVWCTCGLTERRK